MISLFNWGFLSQHKRLGLGSMLHHKSKHYGVIEFKPLTKKDLPLMTEWFQEPTIKKWYARNQHFLIVDIAAKYTPRIQGLDSVPSFIVYLDQKPIGFIQYYSLKDYLPEGIIGKDASLFQESSPEQLVGLDLFIAEKSCRGIGLGQHMVSRFIAEQLSQYKAVVVDPHRDNQQAIACYQNLGFVQTSYSEDPNHLVMVKMLSK